MKPTINVLLTEIVPGVVKVSMDTIRANFGTAKQEPVHARSKVLKGTSKAKSKK